MNQAIQVLDGCTYITLKNALKVDIMASGQMLACYIGGSDKQSLIELYNAKQFEIEEIIEENLKLDKFNSDGELWLTAELVYAY
jgi:hypothetical protein